MRRPAIVGVRSGVLAAVGAAVAIGATPALGQSSILDLGAAQGDPTTNYAVSGDGNTVIGPMSGGQIWNSATGYGHMPEYLGHGNVAAAFGLSYDGSVIVGQSVWWEQQKNRHVEAFRWTQSGGYQALSGGQARGVSSSGAVSVGDDAPLDTGFPLQLVHGRRWTGSVTQQFVPGYVGQVYGVSGDGSTVVGWGLDNINIGPTRAYRWRVSGGLQELAPGFGQAYAYAANTNGSVIVGAAGINWAGQALPSRWTAATGTVLLPVPAGTARGGARAVSGDGSVAVGELGGGASAAMWTTQGYVSLEQYLADSGVNLTGWHLSSAMGISANGTRIVGYGTYNGATHGWLATIPAPGGAVVFVAGGLVALRRRRR